MTKFIGIEEDNFRPEYGGVEWIRRLNGFLELVDAEIEPVGIDRKGVITQLTQENTFIWWNMVADEMDAVSFQIGSNSIWWFREMLDATAAENVNFQSVVENIGKWATQTMSLYPQEHVVQAYNVIYAPKIPDELPEDFS